MLLRSKTIKELIRRLARDESGVAAIEFGIVATIIILMMVMATDLGLAMRHRSQMESAVRAGLQKALDDSASLTDVEDTALAATDLPVSPAATASAERQCYCPDGTDVDCATGSCGAVKKQEYVDQTLTQDHSWLYGVPGLPNPTSLTISHSLRVE